MLNKAWHKNQTNLKNKKAKHTSNANKNIEGERKSDQIT